MIGIADNQIQQSLLALPDEALLEDFLQTAGVYANQVVVTS